MADDTAREDLNAIVQAIGFGIVSDFRELREAMGNFAYQTEESNRLLGNVNQNLESTNRAIDQLEKDVYRQIDSRQFRQLENQIEAKNRQSARKSDEIMNSILSAINDIKKQVGAVKSKAEAEANRNNSTGGGGVVSEVDQFLAKMANIPAGGSSEPSLGTKIAAGAGAVAIVGGVGLGAMAAGAMMNSPPAATPSLAPSAPALPVVNSPGPAMPSSASMAASPASTSSTAPTSSRPSSSSVNLNSASQTVSAIATTAKSKALAKVQNKASNWFSQNGGRIVDTIGSSQIPIFSKLIGGRFSFSRFMSDDSWTELGLYYVSGRPLPEAQDTDPNSQYVTQVIMNLSIQAYLIAREIYTDQNSAEIQNNLVPNFDDVPVNDRKQVVKNVGASLESYVNFLIDRARSSRDVTGASSATTTPAPDSSGPGGGLAPVDAGGGAGANMGGAAPAGGDSGGAPAEAPGGGESQAGGPSGSPPPVAAGGSAPPMTDSGTTDQAASPADTPAATGGGNEGTDAEVTPSDTTASFSTSSDQAAGLSGGGGLDALKAEIASGEGDYGAYNRGRAGDTPKNKRTIDIQNLTVAQVMELQSQGKLMAVGKYQFIPGTLAEAVDYTGIDTSQKFDSATQEQLFPYLISPAKRPQLASYLSGKSDNEDAALNDLAHEFASIPMSNGRGAYDGDRAGNAAAGGVRRAQKIKGILRGIRSSNTATTSDSPQPMATGGVVTPLPSDAVNSNMSMSLAPTHPYGEAYSVPSRGDSDNEEVTSSSMPIDARSRKVASNPHDDAKNKISSYMYLLNHHFGNLKEEMRQAHEEVTADDYHFGRALDPLV